MADERTSDTSQSMRTGESVGSQLLPVLKFAESRCDNPVHFWGGLLSTLAGAMVRSIGPHASLVLGEAIIVAADRVYEENHDANH